MAVSNKNPSHNIWNTTLYVSVVVAAVLVVTAAALIAIGHLKWNTLILPGYCVAGVSGLAALATLILFITKSRPQNCALSKKEDLPPPPYISDAAKLVALGLNVEI